MSIPLKIYTGQHEPKQKPRPLLWLEPETGKTVAVKEDGKYITALWNHNNRYAYAKLAFDAEGYDTSWAIWDENGAFAGWAE